MSKQHAGNWPMVTFTSSYKNKDRHLNDTLWVNGQIWEHNQTPTKFNDNQTYQITNQVLTRKTTSNTLQSTDNNIKYKIITDV